MRAFYGPVSFDFIRVALYVAVAHVNSSWEKNRTLADHSNQSRYHRNLERQNIILSQCSDTLYILMV